MKALIRVSFVLCLVLAVSLSGCKCLCCGKVSCERPRIEDYSPYEWTQDRDWHWDRDRYVDRCD
jgi:hypothetical protein